MTRAVPGKCPLLVPASLRNPQHFHRLCTGLAPLRTSHPHVCAQTAGEQSSGRLAGWLAGRQAGSSGSARAPVRVCPASAPRASIRDSLVPSSPPAGVRMTSTVAGCEPSREPGRALVGTDMIKVLANRKPLPGCRWLPNSMQFIGCCGHSCVGWRRTSISVRCGPTANRRL